MYVWSITLSFYAVTWDTFLMYTLNMKSINRSEPKDWKIEFRNKLIAFKTIKISKIFFIPLNTLYLQNKSIFLVITKCFKATELWWFSENVFSVIINRRNDFWKYWLATKINLKSHKLKTDVWTVMKIY